MTAALVSAAAYLVLAGSFAYWLGRVLRRVADASFPPPSWIPDTAEEFMEMTR